MKRLAGSPARRRQVLVDQWLFETGQRKQYDY